MIPYPTTKITIITVVYNAKDDLEKTILSVINQTYPNIEYIIIDGGSTDGTLDIIKKYEDKITHWISEPDDGIYDAMNKGIDLATGEWINFMNAGDTFYNESVVERVFEYNVEGYDFVYGNQYFYFTSGKFSLIESSYNLKNIFYNMPFGHQACFISTKIHKEIKYNLFYELSADYDFILRCYMKGCKFKKLDFVICNFFDGGRSSIYRFKSLIETLKILVNYTDLETIQGSEHFGLFLNNFCKHGTAKSRIQNQLSYKLGQTMIINSKNIFGVLFMPVYIISTLLSHRQEKKIYQEKIKKNPNLKLPPLESYPDYKEALKEKECLTYKLGEVLIKANKTWYKGGYVKLIFEVGKLLKNFHVG